MIDAKNKLKSKWAAIFDVDGTMVDNAHYHEQAWIEFGRRRNLPITREFYHEHIHSRSNDKNVRLFFPDATDETIEFIANEKEAIYRETFRPVIKEIPGLTAFLQQLSAAGIPCAAASNSPAGNVDMVLDELNIRHIFQVVIDRDQVTIGKPNPEIFHRCAGELGIAPSRCVVFEDSLSGFKAARNAGMILVAITAGSHSTCLEQAAQAHATYENFTGLSVPTIESLVRKVSG